MDQKVDTEKLNQAGTNIAALAPGLSSAKDRVVAVEVRPGAFTDADTLKGKVKTVVDAYVLAIHDLRGLVEDLDRKLKKVALDYQNAEHDNTELADGIPELAGRYHFTLPPPVPPDQKK
jgi:hypothetical protein